MYNSKTSSILKHKTRQTGDGVSPTGPPKTVLAEYQLKVQIYNIQTHLKNKGSLLPFIWICEESRTANEGFIRVKQVQTSKILYFKTKF